jgi:hypothetical protein
VTGSPPVEGFAARLQRGLSARWLRWLGLVLGAGLLVACIVMVVGSGSLRSAWDALRSPPPLATVVLVAAVLANLILTALMFSLLIARYARVGWGEMQALIAASALFNFLPLRPGLLGRVAYHKTVNGIALTDMARVMIEALVISMAAVGWLLLSVPMARATGLSPWWFVAAPAPLLALGGCWTPARRLAWAALMRHIEMMIWAARYWAVFAMIGSPIETDTALVLAAVSVTATLVPFLSNGLGLREWAIGAAGPMLTAFELEHGMTAELVNRGAEMIIFLVAGLIAIAWLAPMMRRRGITKRRDLEP